MTRLHTNYECSTCGGIVSSGIPHDCTPKLLERIAELTAELAEEKERGVAYLEGLLEINPQATLASTLDIIHATSPVDYGPYEERRMKERGKHDAEQLIRMLDAERELAVHERALEMACKTLFDEGIWFMPGGEQVKSWQGWRAVFMKRAQKELADD